MFLFIGFIFVSVQCVNQIQIHLMFLFISPEAPEECPAYSFKYISCSYLSNLLLSLCNTHTQFKYISCSYLSRPRMFCGTMTLIQIHLMFLFILNGAAGSNTQRSIQIHLMFLFILNLQISLSHLLNSNTSHVLIYLKCSPDGKAVSKFKYISCSYLSIKTSNILQSMQ